MTVRVPLLIHGDWRETEDTIRVIDPYRRSVSALVASPKEADVDDAVRWALVGAADMAALPTHRRSTILKQVADGLSRAREAFAERIVYDCGKCLKDARGEVTRAIEVLEISAEEATKGRGEVIPLDALPAGEGLRLGLTMRFPVGVVAAIGPYNAPLYIMAHKLGPAFAAGNAVVCKPALHGAAVTADMARLFLNAGLPPTALQVLPGGGDTIGDYLVSHPGVDLIAFTGSGRVGERIVRTAGLKRTLLELSGNGAAVIHDDADWESAVANCIPAAYALSGQSCVSLQRLYVHRSIFSQVSRRFAELTASLRQGDTLDETTDVGVMLNDSAADRIERWVQEAVSGGATVLAGGSRNGTSIQPTVLTNVQPEMKVVCDEVFGPVVSLIPYDSLEEALHSVNDSPWGLASGVFTRSLDVALRAARGLRTGVININAPSRFRVEHMPFGGVKQSGWGKEGPRYAIDDMSEIRMVIFSGS